MIEDAVVETHSDAERIRWATSFLSDDAATLVDSCQVLRRWTPNVGRFQRSITTFESSRKVEDAREKLLTLRQEGSVC
jgi:hypothetical protein